MSVGAPPGPPRLAAALLRTALADDARAEALLGDLEELWREREARFGRARATLWYARQAVTAAWRYRATRRARDITGTGGDPMSDLVEGITRVVRSARRNPTFTLATVGTLALGVGAVAAVASLISGVLIERLPYPEPDRVVFLHDDNDGIDMPPGFATVPNFLDWREHAASFESVALFRGRSASVTTEVIPEYAYGAFVTPAFFDVFGTLPELGRAFTADEAAPGGPPVVVLGHGLWTRGFGADPGLLGRTVGVDGTPHTVVGVMPEGFEAHGDWVGLPVLLWRPLPITEDLLGQGRSYHVAARLADGVGLVAARAEMAALTTELTRLRPEENEGWYVRVDPYQQMIVGEVAPALWLLLATTVLLLVIACANVASLTLNRVLDRSGELATRRALGASRPSVVALVFGESAGVALAGGVLGLGLAQGLLAVVRATEPGLIPRLESVGLDVRVVAFTLVLVGLSAVASGSAAAFSAARAAPAGTLRAARGGGGRSRARQALVAGQLVLSFGLLATAGLLSRSFMVLRGTDLGLEPAHVTAATVALSWSRVNTLDERARFTTEVLRALREIPGVESAGMINSLPLSGSDATQQIEIEGVTEPGREPAVAARGISPGYLATFGIPVVAGRDFAEADLDDPRTALVNRASAARYWPGVDPVGRRVRFKGDADWLTVVGVVGDVRHYGPDRPARPELYVTYPVEFLTSKTYVVRWTHPDAARPLALRDAIHAVDPQQPVREVRTMDEWVAQATAAPRFQALTMVLAAGLATTLALVGLFGVLAGLVRARTPELALRVALGAPRRRVLALVTRAAVTLVGTGVIGGGTLAWLLGDTLQRFLFGVTAQDPRVLGVAALLFVSAGALAALLPARRATSVDPAAVLREG